MGRCFVVTFLLLGALSTVAAKGYLYGLNSTLSGKGIALELIEYDAETATEVKRGSFEKYELTGQGLACIDDNRGVYYTLATNATTNKVALLGISLQTLSLDFEFELPILNEGFVGVGQYCNVDSESGVVIVEGRDIQSPNRHHLWAVNPKTKRASTLARLPDEGRVDILGGFSVLDLTNLVEWLQLAFNDSGIIGMRFYGFDAKTGFTLNILDDPENLATGRYDPKTDLIWGIGTRVNEEKQEFEHTLVSLNSIEGTFTIKSIVPFVQFMPAISAIDVVGRKLFIFMSNMTHKTASAQRYCTRFGLTSSHLPVWCRNYSDDDDDDGNLDAKPTPPPLPPMDLVTIDIDSGKVIAHPQMCKEFPECPRSIEFWDK